MRWRDYQALQQVAELGPRYLAYVDSGSGEPVVLLHGLPTWGYLWHELIPPLERAHRVLVPDLLGYGSSDKRDAFSRSVPRQAEVLADWLDELGVTRAALVGHDLGGAVALRFACLAPQRVTRLVLVDALAYDAWPHDDFVQLASPKARRLPDLHRLMAVHVRYGFLGGVRDSLVEGLLAPWRTDVGQRSLARNAASLDANHTIELQSRLLHLRVPALVLWGALDPFSPIAIGERLAGDLPSAHLVRIDDAGHFPMFDQRELVTDLLMAFLASPLHPELEAR